MPKVIETIKRTGRTRQALLLALGGLAVIALMWVGVALARPNSSPRTFTGEIQDSTCAGTAKHVEGECAMTCVRSGAKWVLYDPLKQEMYRLSDQETPISFAAQQVSVVGTLDKSTHTIHVVKISSAQAARPHE